MPDLGPARTAALFARLKIRLIRNGVRQSGMAAIGSVLGSTFAVIGGLAGFGLALASGRVATEDAAVWAVLVPATLAIGWTLLPLIAFGTDETLDPGRLALTPLPARRLVVGLAAASAVGFGPAVVWATLAGLVVGHTPSGVGAVLVPMAVVLHGALCIVLARAMATVLAALLSSRRGQDTTLTAAGLIGFAALGAGQLAQHLDELGADGLRPLADVLAWTPFGLAGAAIADVGSGAEGAAVTRLAAVAALVLLFGWGWAWALSRSLERTAASGSAPRRRRRSSSWLPPTVWAAVAAKEWRYLRREPRRRVQLITAVVVGVVLPLSVVVSAPDPPDPAVLAGSVAGYLAVLTSFNQFGFDGGALWIDVVAGNAVRDALLGKNAVAALVVFVAAVLAAVVLAAVTGGWAYLPVALLLAVGATGVGLGVANVISAVAPVPLPESSNPFASAGAGKAAWRRRSTSSPWSCWACCCSRWRSASWSPWPSPRRRWPWSGWRRCRTAGASGDSDSASPYAGCGGTSPSSWPGSTPGWRDARSASSTAWRSSRPRRAGPGCRPPRLRGRRRGTGCR